MKQHLVQCCRLRSDCSFRSRLNTWLFDLNNPVGKALNLTIMVFILCGVFVSMLETLHEGTSAWGSAIHMVGVAATILFGVEYLLRLYAAKSSLRYAFSFYGIVDLLAVLPALLLGDFNISIRLLRVLRLLKLIRYLKALEMFVKSLQGVFEIMLVSMIAISIIALLGGNLMYYLEPSSVQNAFGGVWWALVTMTTVGYGDIVPQTPAGKIDAIFIMMFGLAMFAMLTGTIAVKIAHILSHKTSCPRCSRPVPTESVYCNFCGVNIDSCRQNHEEMH